MANKENKVQKEILKFLQANGIFCWRNNNTAIYDQKLQMYRSFQGLRGVGDIIGILPDGRFLSVECKSKTGKASPDQLLFIRRCSQLGGVCLVANCVDDVRRVIPS